MAQSASSAKPDAAPARRDRASSARVRHPWIAAGLIAVLAWAPLPLASNRMWSWSLLTVIGSLLVLAVVVTVWRQRLPVRGTRLMFAGFVCIALAMAWAMVQQMPWTPASWHHPLWQAAARYGLDVQGAIGIEPFGGLVALLRFAGYAAIFWVAFVIGQDAPTASRLAYAIVVIVTAYAVYGLAMRLTGIESILWVEKVAYIGSVTATFVNRNNFATWCNLGIVTALALVVERLLRESNAGWRRALYDMLNELFGKRMPLVLAVAVMTTASLLSLSRGGLLGLAAGVLVLFGIVLMVARSRMGLGLVAVSVLVAVASIVVYVSGEDTLRRLEDVSGDVNLDGQGRFGAWIVCLQLIAERPWLGHGYGGFEQAFMAASPESITTIFDKAHNTFLEHAVVLGLPAAALLYAGYLMLLLACIRGIRERRRDRVFPLVALTAAVVVGVHALVDFSLQIPAVAVTFATLLGIGLAQSMRSAQATAREARPRGLPRLTMRDSKGGLAGAAAE